MKQNSHKDLFRAIASLKDVEECERFLNDLCTPQELDALAGRWRVAKLLDQELPYREIYERTGVSTATVTRVARALTHGESGYRRILDRLSTKNKETN
jgi:TrpR-related protein YerC/YecD